MPSRRVKGDPSSNLRNRRPQDRIIEAERALKALTAVRAGATYEQAAELAGYSGRQGAHTAVMRHLERTAQDLKEHADAFRALEVARLDRALVEITRVAFAPDADPTLKLKYLEALNRNVRTRAAILGLNAPVQHEVFTHESLDREILAAAARIGMDPNVIEAELIAIGRGSAPQDADLAGVEEARS